MLTPAAHLTCVAATRADVDAVIAALCAKPACATSWRCAAIRRAAPASATRRIPAATATPPISSPASSASRDIEVSVSAYPEKHPDSPSVAADIDMLKAKVDAGATRAITQFFFENDLYFRYLDRVRAAGIDIPIVPGILPVQNFKRRKISPRAAAPRCRTGSPSASMASTTMRRRAS